MCSPLGLRRSAGRKPASAGAECVRWDSGYICVAYKGGCPRYAPLCLEQNPVRARLVRAPWRYVWSSARAHAEGKDPAGRLNLEWFAKRMSPVEWRTALGERAESGELDILRRRLARGWPLASDRWLAKMEKVVGRRLRPLPVGWQKGRKRGRRVR